jgi:cell division septum initiation protein DivIVA
MIEAGKASYDLAVAEGKAEQERLISQAEVVQAAHAESARVIDSAHAESDRLRADSDLYVDTKLAEFEEFLTGTIRSVGRGRQQLRTGTGVPDYAAEYKPGRRSAERR